MKKILIGFSFLLFFSCIGYAQGKIRPPKKRENPAPAQQNTTPPVFTTRHPSDIYLEGKQAYDAGNYEKAVTLFKEAAEYSNFLALYYLGEMYYYGKGVSQSYTESADYFRRAATQGYAPAQAYIGFMYKKGYGVPQDYTTAMDWLMKAAENGSAMGQNSLGEMYFYGHGTKVDYSKAAYWYTRSANLGYADAQFNMGWMCEFGLGGISKNITDAVEWYRKAARNGNHNAIERLNKLGYTY